MLAAYMNERLNQVRPVLAAYVNERMYQVRPVLVAYVNERLNQVLAKQPVVDPINNKISCLPTYQCVRTGRILPQRDGEKN